MKMPGRLYRDRDVQAPSVPRKPGGRDCVILMGYKDFDPCKGFSGRPYG